MIASHLTAIALSLGATFATAGQACDTSFVDARDVAAHLKAIPVAEWHHATIAQFGPETRGDVRKHLAADKHKLTHDDDYILRRVERAQKAAERGRSRPIDMIGLLGRATPATRKALEQVFSGKTTIQQARLEATLETLKLNEQRLATFDAIRPEGCLSLTTPAATPAGRGGHAWSLER